VKYREPGRRACGVRAAQRRCKTSGCDRDSREQGLNAHIEDVTRRIALEGFLALAPDALSPVGGTPPDETKAVEMIYKLDMKSTISNFVAAVKYLRHTHVYGQGRSRGLCWGGEMTNQVAVNSPDVSAAVPYYGGSLPLKMCPNKGIITSSVCR